MAESEAAYLSSLAARAKRREASAFEELFEQFFEKLRRYAYYQLGDLDRAEDLAADVIRAAIESIDRFDDQGGSLGAWIYGIARNLIARQHKERGAGREVGIEESDGLHSAEFTEDLVIKDLSYLELYEAISHLPAEQREVIVLRYIEGYGSKAVAEIMDKRPGAIRAIQHRAIKSLRRRMATQVPVDRAPGAEDDGNKTPFVPEAGLSLTDEAQGWEPSNVN
jgi:RNA polymerase sigma-70 factor (ECF subfamily)